MPEISRRGFVAVLGGGAVASTAAVSTLVAGWPDGARVKSRGRGRWTRFGTVAVLGATRRELVSADAGEHAHHAAMTSASTHTTWSGRVEVEVEVHNGTDRPILVSPGQFRLRVGNTGPTVSPYEAGWPVGPLAPAATVTSWVSYLAPDGDAELWVEYVDPAATAAQAFPIVPEVLA
jgi:hypothetical protein